MFKFLPGVILLQAVTCGLMLMAFNWSHDFQLVLVIAVIGLISSLLVSLWFSSIARNIAIDDKTHILEKHVEDRESILKQAEKEKAEVALERSNLQDQHAREREKILLDAEKEKANILADSFQHIEKETRKAHSKANLKVGAAFSVAVGAAGVMIFSQLITIGVMLLVASGSGLSGYVLRARHDRISRKKQLTLTHDETKKIL